MNQQFDPLLYTFWIWALLRVVRAAAPGTSRWNDAQLLRSNLTPH